jgi:hypothetical protein
VCVCVWLRLTSVERDLLIEMASDCRRPTDLRRKRERRMRRRVGGGDEREREKDRFYSQAPRADAARADAARADAARAYQTR